MREQILNEIRRLAAANSGKPPGRDVFERETGIRQSAWVGRYWARWGDALTEAGFEPNILQSKSDLNFILHKLAEATRHYGKVPTSAEMRMYARQDQEFPSHTTLFNRLKSKTEMVSQLRDWVSKEPAFVDILPLIPVQATSASPQSKVSQGLVYLIKSGAHYKIGRSDEIERRVKEIRIALPEAASLVHSIRTDDPAGIEAYWHRRFSDRRANGEWFKLSSADVAAFRRRKFQ